MLLSFAIIFLVGLSAAAIFEKIGLPRIIGMLGVGIVVSPYVLDLLDSSVLGISSECSYHHTDKSRAFAESIRPEKSRQTCGHDGICACLL